jgi:hypothetical protein
VLEQPDEDEKVDDLGANGDPVDLHGSATATLLDSIPEGIGEDQDHRNHESVDRR